MKPLYLQCRDNELTDSQFMDLETVDWIEAQSIDGEVVDRMLLSDKDIELLETLAPQRSYFLNNVNYDSIHGVRHIMRVMVNAILVGQLLGVAYQDSVVAASIHDLRRLNDRRDAGHGRRAVDWFTENIDTLPTHAKLLRDAGVIHNSVRYHDTNYEDIPPAVLTAYKQPIDILKAADALDRYRQPNMQWWPNMQYVEIKEVARLCGIAKELVICSERLALTGTEPAHAVLVAARRLLR